MLKCRNCLSNSALISNRGTVAPFFLKRVHNIHLLSIGELLNKKLNALFPNTIIKKILKFSYTELSNSKLGMKLFKFRSPAKVDIFVCKDCGFICPAHIYEASQLLRLYSDYRSESYNLERSFFEPKYRNIMNLVGKSEDEIRNRLDNVGSLISKYTKLESIETVLDWGGAKENLFPENYATRKFLFSMCLMRNLPNQPLPKSSSLLPIKNLILSRFATSSSMFLPRMIF